MNPPADFSVAATDLDSLVWVRRMEGSDEDLARRLRRAEPDNWKMRLGRACDAYLSELTTRSPGLAPGGATTPVPPPEWVSRDGSPYEIIAQPQDATQIAVSAGPYEIAVGAGETESWRIRGKMDGLRGNVITDWKTTTGPVTDDRLAAYAESWQWRAYMAAVPNAARFRYEIFSFMEQPRDSGNFFPRDFHQPTGAVEPNVLELDRYASLEAELTDHLAELVSVIHGLHRLGLVEMDDRGVKRPRKHA